MQMENIPIGDLVPYDRNPRITIEAVPYVEESIKEFGFLVPLVIDNDNVIVTGHTRHQAALRLNYTEVCACEFTGCQNCRRWMADIVANALLSFVINPARDFGLLGCKFYYLP